METTGLYRDYGVYICIYVYIYILGVVLIAQMRHSLNP